MIDRFELWNGIVVSDSIDDVRAKFPDAVGEKELSLGFVDIAGFQFSARWHRWRDADPKVTLLLADECSSIMSLARDVRHILSLKYGRGKAMAKYHGTERKIWDRRYIRVQMTAMKKENESTLYIEYFRPLFLGDNWWAEDVVPSVRNV